MTITIFGDALNAVTKTASLRLTFTNHMKPIGMRKETAMSNRDYDAEYDENVDYDALEQHTYDDAPGQIFYTCPKCSNEYLATFITEENGEVMCIDCWNERYGEK